jgi:gluconokinase
MVLVLMGVSGSGKTTVGQLLSSPLKWQFADADDYHSPENVEKMRHGIPLTDADREPWLDTLTHLIASWIENRQNAILACSALKRTYRERLRLNSDVHFVYLKGSPDLLQQRLRARVGHFMTANMLESQIATLEEPEDAITVDIDRSLQEIVVEIQKRLGLPTDKTTNPI